MPISEVTLNKRRARIRLLLPSNSLVQIFVREIIVGNKSIIVVYGLAIVSTFLVIQNAGSVGHASAGSQVTQRSAAVLYKKYCESCHGKDGRSKTFKAKFNHARNLTEPGWQEAVSDERIYNSISNGRGKMPAFSKKMSEPEIDSLVLFVRNFKGS